VYPAVVDLSSIAKRTLNCL